MPLTEIGEVELCGEKFKLGKNGKVVLVREGMDAWGKAYGEEVDLESWLLSGNRNIALPTLSRAQSLLDLAGDLMQRLQNQRDARLGVGKED